MKILIKKNPSFDPLNNIAGQWITVETDYLFTNQYNTVPFKGCTNGVRVEDKDVEMIIEDARVGMGKCLYCGSMVGPGESCCIYGIEWFTKRNTYFLGYLAPNSIQFIVGDK